MLHAAHLALPQAQSPEAEPRSPAALPAPCPSTHHRTKSDRAIIGVRDVPRSFRWYQTLLGLAPGVPAHPDFGQLLDTDGTVLLCLHEWGVEDHPTITSPDAATPGNGLLLFFRVDDFDAALVRARAAGTPLEEEPHVNPNTRTMEFSLRDPEAITSRSAPPERPA